MFQYYISVTNFFLQNMRMYDEIQYVKIRAYDSNNIIRMIRIFALCNEVHVRECYKTFKRSLSTVLYSRLEVRKEYRYGILLLFFLLSPSFLSPTSPFLHPFVFFLCSPRSSMGNTELPIGTGAQLVNGFWYILSYKTLPVIPSL